MKKMNPPVFTFILFSILSLIVMTSAMADTLGSVAFEPDDTIEEIKEKIAQNGYSFTVSTNHIFNMPRAEKGRFFSRHASSTRSVDTGDIGPLAFQLRASLPSSFDWRNYNGHSYIGAIRDQGNCGSCYSFGAAAAAEGTYNYANNLYDGNCADFSESFIIWCLASIAPYSSHFSGCDGADYDYYELQALTVEGICHESAFPYRVSDPGSCTHWNDPRVVFNSWHRIPCNDIDAIKTAIMTYGVVDAAVKVSSAFEAYNSGIYNDSYTSCSASPCYDVTTDHAISLVGWDDNPPEGGGGCWILRNSWGTGWGENGYMRLRYTSAAVACSVAYLVYTTPGTPPTVTTDPAANETSSSATLNGTVNPQGAATTYYFQYGSTTSYGNTTPTTSAGSGSAAQNVSAGISGLSPSTTYHFRIVAANAAGTVYGSDQTFITAAPTAAAPTVITDPATGVYTNRATIQGRVTPNASPTGYRFQYGTTTSYGSTTSWKAAGNGTALLSVDEQISSLNAETTYHYRLMATNSVGTSYGIDRTLTTASEPSAPTTTTEPANPISAETATLKGTVNPNGASTTYHFEYGTTTSYGSTTPSASAGAGNSPVSVSSSASGLSPSTTYHFRLVAQNSKGTSYGSDMQFNTAAQSTELLVEDFENGGSIPSGWTTDYISGSVNWIYVNGDGGYDHPSSAHSGSYDAYLFAESYDQKITRLITPAINFGSRTNEATLTFWLFNEEWCYWGACDQDILKIYYKTSAAGSWTLLHTYNANTAQWTLKTLSLPNVNSTYYIAFEGTANWGYGICVDDVEVSAEASSTTPPPTASTLPASSILSSSVRLNGTINPNGSSTTFYFEYGTTTAYGTTTPTGSAGDGSTATSIHADISSLTPDTAYHCRLVATSSGGVSYGADITFTTASTAPGAPSVQTDPASQVNADSATLNGRVNPNGASTTWHFEYGTTTAYGTTTPSVSAGSGTKDVAAQMNITGLSPSSTYHFRMVATSTAGTSYGSDETLNTSSENETVFAENFEHNGSLPIGWTQDYIAAHVTWSAANGSPQNQPDEAYAGSYNALFYGTNGTTRLITPVIDFGSKLNNTVLTFWHYMEEWWRDQDELRIYYRTSAGGSWVLLETYNANVDTWTQRTLTLPNPGATYYLAFEGKAQWGYGVCVDNIEITGDTSPTPTPTPTPTPPAYQAINDFDGDGKSDVGVYWPQGGIWYLQLSADASTRVVNWGWGDAIPAVGDYNHDTLSDIAVYWPAGQSWFILYADGSSETETGWGSTGSVPVPGDYDGDGTTDFAYFETRNGELDIEYSSGGTDVRYFSTYTTPITGDYDGDGTSDKGIYSAYQGLWSIILSEGSSLNVGWGWNQAFPVPADYDGDGATDIAVYWPAQGAWYILQSSNNQAITVYWGWNAAYPVPADYDGDGFADIAVYWPVGGVWYIYPSSTKAGYSVNWGWYDAIPVLPQYIINTYNGI